MKGATALLWAVHTGQPELVALLLEAGADKVAVNTAAVRDHVQGVIAAIAPNDSVERFEGLGDGFTAA